MGLLDRFKKGKKNSDSSAEMQRLYDESMKALDSAVTTEDKEVAAELADKNLDDMQKVYNDGLKKTFTDLDSEVEKSKKRAVEAAKNREANIEFLEQLMHDSNNKPAAKNTASRIADTAREAMQEMLERQYSSIIDAREALRLKEGGNQDTDNLLKKISEGDRKYLFYPFLVEKKDFMGLTEDETKEFDDMELWIGSSGMTLEDGYERAVENLHMLGLTDIMDSANFMTTFDKKVKEGTSREKIAAYAELRNNRANNYYDAKGHGSR